MIYSQSMKVERDIWNTPERKLEEAVFELGIKPNDRDALKGFEQGFWDFYGEKLDKKFVVNSAPTYLTSEKIKEFHYAEKMIIYFPENITSGDIIKMCPGISGGKMGQNIKVVDPTPQYGYLVIDASRNAPRLNMNPETEDVKKELKANGGKIISINELAIAVLHSNIADKMYIGAGTATHIRDKTINRKNGYPSKVTSLHAGIYGEGGFNVIMSGNNFRSKNCGIRTALKL